MPWGSRGVPCQASWGGYPGRGGYPGWGGTLAGGRYPGWGAYPGQGGTQLGQHREYLLHGGRYASCVHAGGLSCLPTIYSLIPVWESGPMLLPGIRLIIKVPGIKLVYQHAWFHNRNRSSEFKQKRRLGKHTLIRTFVFLSGWRCFDEAVGRSVHVVGRRLYITVQAVHSVDSVHTVSCSGSMLVSV